MLGYRVDLVVGIDEPCIRDTGGAATADLGVGADPDRGHGFLNGQHGAVGVVEFEIARLHGDEFPGPQALDAFQAFLEARTGLFHGGAECLELDLAVADARAEDQFPVAHDIEGGEFLRHVQRAVQGQQHHARTEAQFRRDHRDLAEIGDLLDILERMRTVMRALADHVVAKLLGAFGGGEVFLQADAHVVAQGVLAADDQAKAHGVLPLVGGSVGGAGKGRKARGATLDKGTSRWL